MSPAPDKFPHPIQVMIDELLYYQLHEKMVKDMDRGIATTIRYILEDYFNSLNTEPSAQSGPLVIGEDSPEWDEWKKSNLK